MSPKAHIRRMPIIAIRYDIRKDKPYQNTAKAYHRGLTVKARQDRTPESMISS